MDMDKERKELYGRGEGIRGVLLLFVILIGAALAVLGLMIFLSKISEPIRVSSFEIVSLEGGKILVKNTGEVAIKKGELSVLVNGQRDDSINEDIGPGQAGVIEIKEPQKEALISVKLGKQEESVPTKPASPTTSTASTTTIPSRICPAVCVPMWQLKQNSCTYTSCGSGCGPDNSITFSTESLCKQRIIATSITTPIPLNASLTAKLTAPATAEVNKSFTVTVKAQSGAGINRLALFYNNSWQFYGCAGNQICENTWSITEKAGTYLYYGYVDDAKGSDWTSPRHILVTVGSQQA